MAGGANRRPAAFGGAAELAEARAAPERTAVGMRIGNLDWGRAVRVPPQL
jgi:hypothetical protein